MFTAQRCESYGKTTDKLVLRVFKDGYINAVLAQWRFDYISKGCCPIQYGDFNVPNDILEDLFRDSFPEHFSNKVFNTPKSISNKPITNAPIPTTDVITKNNVIISAIRNSGGNKDILMKCLELSNDYNVINEVINNCNSDPSVILHCLSLIESTDSDVSIVEEEPTAVIPIDDESCNEDVSDNNYTVDTEPIANEEELDAAATIEDTTDNIITTITDDIITTITDDITHIKDDVPIVSTDPPAPRRRGKVRYNI